VVAAAGSFAAVSTLLGSPLLGAFLLMEASGLGGAMLELVLVPGLLAASDRGDGCPGRLRDPVARVVPAAPR
jgi:hypothetical protein